MFEFLSFVRSNFKFLGPIVWRSKEYCGQHHGQTPGRPQTKKSACRKRNFFKENPSTTIQKSISGNKIVQNLMKINKFSTKILILY